MELRVYVGTKRETEIDTERIRKQLTTLDKAFPIDWEDPSISWMSDTICALCDCIDCNVKAEK